MDFASDLSAGKTSYCEGTRSPRHHAGMPSPNVRRVGARWRSVLTSSTSAGQQLGSPSHSSASRVVGNPRSMGDVSLTSVGWHGGRNGLCAGGPVPVLCVMPVAGPQHHQKVNNILEPILCATVYRNETCCK